MAGLLTFSLSRRLPIANRATVAGCLESTKEITAAGTVRDFHPVPFSFRQLNSKRKTNPLQRYNIFMTGSKLPGLVFKIY
jgi:hypothetical protein